MPVYRRSVPKRRAATARRHRRARESEEGDRPSEGQRAERQGRGEAVPESEAGGRSGARDGRRWRGRSGQTRVRARRPRITPMRAENERPQPHAPAALRGRRASPRHRPRKGAMPAISPAAPRHMLAATTSCTRAHRSQAPGSVARIDAVVELLLGDEAAEQRYARHRTGRQRRGESRRRHRPAQSAERGHVPRARLVLDGAGDEEEGALVAAHARPGRRGRR